MNTKARKFKNLNLNKLHNFPPPANPESTNFRTHYSDNHGFHE